ncbi:MAG: hypothetical protein H0T44_04425 [Gemmatimonadales bacterium]|nr:hypothetical protein [Gemmatimonadales bacterium]
MRRTRDAAPLLLLLVLLVGCVQTFDATTLGVPAALASPAGQPPQGPRFSVTTRAVFGIWGLLRFRDPSLRKALAAQLVGGSGIADLRIRVRSRWSDLLITGLTLGLIVPRSVTYEGVVTGLPAPAAP